MKADRWREVEALFDQALLVPLEQREDFLLQRCGGDQALQQEVLSLLASDDHVTGFLHRGVPQAMADGPPAETDAMIGEALGPYRVVRRVGRGGMGIVYEAERADDSYQQRVAIKVVQHGMATEEVLERFRRERQALATLRHPGIAQLLDGGLTVDGRPYLVMEFVDGRPIDEFCDQARLDLKQRVKLIVKVCAAVQSAHEQLLVHRDLKPANVLVREDGEPVLLDFGIAKVVDEAVDATALTVDGARMMTPRYASPEQVKGEPVTTRSDVYALGVLLYELLAGENPYADATSPTALHAAICDHTPPLPSHRNQRQGRRLAGDLDSIVMMALRKEPGRRYESATALAADLGHWLADMPVVARPDTTTYRLRKLVTRHPLVTGGGTIAGLAIASLAVVSTVQYLRADQARGEAVAARKLAEDRLEEVTIQKDITDSVNEFFQRDFLMGADPDLVRDKDVTMKQVLDAAAARIEDRFVDAPLVEAGVRFAVGTTYFAYGFLAQAEPQLRRSRDLRLACLGTDSPETWESQRDLASCLDRQGHLDEAIALNEELLGWQEELIGRDDGYTQVTMGNLALLLQTVGRTDEARVLYEEQLEFRLGRYGENHENTLTTYNNLGGLLLGSAGPAEAEPYLRKAMEIRIHMLGADHPKSLISRGNYAALRFKQGEIEEAIRRFEEMLPAQERVTGPAHPYSLHVMRSLVVALILNGDLEHAEELADRAVDVSAEAHGENSLDTARCRYRRAQVYAGLEYWEEGAAEFTAALESLRGLIGDDHALTRQVARELKDVARSGGLAGSESLADEILR